MLCFNQNAENLCMSLQHPFAAIISERHRQSDFFLQEKNLSISRENQSLLRRGGEKYFPLQFNIQGVFHAWPSHCAKVGRDIIICSVVKLFLVYFFELLRVITVSNSLIVLNCDRCRRIQKGIGNAQEA